MQPTTQQPSDKDRVLDRPRTHASSPPGGSPPQNRGPEPERRPHGNTAEPSPTGRACFTCVTTRAGLAAAAAVGASVGGGESVPSWQATGSPAEHSGVIGSEPGDDGPPALSPSTASTHVESVRMAPGRTPSS